MEPLTAPSMQTKKTTKSHTRINAQFYETTDGIQEFKFFDSRN